METKRMWNYTINETYNTICYFHQFGFGCFCSIIIFQSNIIYLYFHGLGYYTNDERFQNQVRMILKVLELPCRKQLSPYLMLLLKILLQSLRRTWLCRKIFRIWNFGVKEVAFLDVLFLYHIRSTGTFKIQFCVLATLTICCLSQYLHAASCLFRYWIFNNVLECLEPLSRFSVLYLFSSIHTSYWLHWYGCHN